MNGCLESIKALLDAGANSRLTNDYGKDAVAYCSEDMRETVEQLIDDQLELDGADIPLVDAATGGKNDSEEATASDTATCKCETCRIYTIVGTMEDRDGRPVSGCPCSVHCIMMATKMFSSKLMLLSDLDRCDCEACTEAREKLDDIAGPRNCACAACLAKSGKRANPTSNNNQDPSTTRHYGIWCDGISCQQQESLQELQGVRYKCTVCYDTDFCESCQALHDPTHELKKIKVTMMRKYDKIIASQIEVACSCDECTQEAHEHLRRLGFVNNKKDYRVDPTKAWDYIMDLCESGSDRALVRKLVTLLLDNNAPIDTKDKKGTLLHRAVEAKDIVLVDILIRRKATLDIQISKLLSPKYNWTPLKCAVESANPAMVRLLLLSGANINKQDTDGKTALDIAIE